MPPVRRLVGGVLVVLSLAGCAASGPVLVAPEVTATNIQSARHHLARHQLPESRDTPIHAMEDELHRVFGRLRPAIIDTCLEAFGRDPNCRPFVRDMQVELVFEDSVNAYADSREYAVGVHMGLMSSVGSDDELAWVLAHEAGHLLLGHGDKKATSSMAYGLLGAALAAALGAAAYEPGMDAGYVGDVAEAGMTIGSHLGYLAYSPEMELEADQFAVHVLRRAGLRPRASMDMIVRLDRGDVPEQIRFWMARLAPARPRV